MSYRGWKHDGQLQLEPFLTARLGYEVEIGPSVFDPDTFAIKKELFVEGRSVGYTLPELYEDAHAFGISEDVLLDFMANCIRERRGEKVAPRPWLRIPHKEVAAVLVQNVAAEVAEIRVADTIKTRAIEACEYFVSWLEQQPSEVVTSPLRAPCGALLVEERDRIRMPPATAITNAITFHSIDSQRIGMALIRYFEARFAELLKTAEVEGSKGPLLYFAPYCVPLPQQNKPDVWRVRYAIYMHTLG